MTINPEVPFLDGKGELATPTVLAQIDARAKGAVRADLPALAKEISVVDTGVALTANDSIDTLAPGPDYWVLSTEVATALGMPEPVHGVVKVFKWDGKRGITLFVTRTMPSRIWSVAYGITGKRDGGWMQVSGDFAKVTGRLDTLEQRADAVNRLTTGEDTWDNLGDGTFYVTNGTHATTLGMPVTQHGFLWIKRPSSSAGSAYFFPRSGPGPWRREMSSTGWGAWSNIGPGPQAFALITGTPTWDQLPDGTHYVFNSTQTSTLGLPAAQHGLVVKMQSSASAGGAWFLPRSGDFMWRRQFSSTGWGAWEKVQSGSGAGAGVEEVSGVVTLGASGPAYRQFYTLAQTNFTIEGTDAAVMVPPSQAIAWRRDVHGQWGYQKAADAWTAPPSFPDSVVPGAGSLSASMSSTSAYLTVGGATDDRGIAHYEFSKDGGASWTVPTPDPSYRFVELTRATEYQFRHRVTDTSGNTAVGAIVTRSTL